MKCKYLQFLTWNKFIRMKFDINLIGESLVKLFFFHKVRNASHNCFEEFSSFYIYFLNIFIHEFFSAVMWNGRRDFYFIVLLHFIHIFDSFRWSRFKLVNDRLIWICHLVYWLLLCDIIMLLMVIRRLKTIVVILLQF